MKKRHLLGIITGLALMAATQAGAALINFSEAPIGATDPTIGAVSFRAGSGAAQNDTIVGDDWTPGNNYLYSGIDDGTNGTPGSSNNFLAARLNTPGLRFSTISFDITFESPMPIGYSGSFAAYFFNSGSGIPSPTFTLAENETRHITVANGSSVNDDFGVMGLIDPVSQNALFFHIDNFSYDTARVPSNTVPVPTSALLLGCGLVVALASRKKIRM